MLLPVHGVTINAPVNNVDSQNSSFVASFVGSADTKGIFLHYKWTFSEGDSQEGLYKTSVHQIFKLNDTLPTFTATLEVSNYFRTSSANTSVSVSYYGLAPNVKRLPDDYVSQCGKDFIVVKETTVPLKVGDIVYGSSCNHFVAKVLSFSFNEKKIQTGNVSVTDIFEFAVLSGDLSSMGDSVNAALSTKKEENDAVSDFKVKKSSKGPGFELEPASVSMWYQAGGSISVIPYFSYNTDVSMVCIINGRKFKEFSLITRGEMSAGISINIAVNQQFSISLSKPVLPSIPMGRFAFWAGEIPIVVYPYFEVDVSLSYEAKQKEFTQYKLGFKSEATLGASWTSADGFQLVNNFGVTSDNQFPPAVGACSESISLTINPKINFKLYDFYPQLPLGISFGGELATNFPPTNWDCQCYQQHGYAYLKSKSVSLDRIFDGTIGLSLGILSKDWDFYKDESELWSNCMPVGDVNCGDCYCDWTGFPCCPWGGCECSWWSFGEGCCLCIPWVGNNKGVCGMNQRCSASLKCSSDSNCAKGWKCTVNTQCGYNQCTQTCGGMGEGFTPMDAQYNDTWAYPISRMRK